MDFISFASTLTDTFQISFWCGWGKVSLAPCFVFFAGSLKSWTTIWHSDLHGVSSMVCVGASDLPTLLTSCLTAERGRSVKGEHLHLLTWTLDGLEVCTGICQWTYPLNSYSHPAYFFWRKLMPFQWWVLWTITNFFVFFFWVSWVPHVKCSGVVCLFVLSPHWNLG